MIISRSYFKGHLAIANAQDTAPNSNLLGNKTLVDIDIQKYERDALLKCLGYPLYNEFKSNFDIDDNDVWTLKAGSVGTKWDDLLNGKEYTLNAVTVKWRGLIYTDSTVTDASKDSSLLAYYVYAKFIENDQLRHSGVGVQVENPKNANIQTGASKWAWAMNEFVKMVMESNGYERGLYDFIQDMNDLDSTTYDDWNYECLKYVNRWGI